MSSCTICDDTRPVRLHGVLVVAVVGKCDGALRTRVRFISEEYFSTQKQIACVPANPRHIRSHTCVGMRAHVLASTCSSRAASACVIKWAWVIYNWTIERFCDRDRGIINEMVSGNSVLWRRYFTGKPFWCLMMSINFLLHFCIQKNTDFIL